MCICQQAANLCQRSAAECFIAILRDALLCLNSPFLLDLGSSLNQKGYEKYIHARARATLDARAHGKHGIPCRDGQRHIYTDPRTTSAFTALTNWNLFVYLMLADMN